jgi:hypothetical protein
MNFGLEIFSKKQQTPIGVILCGESIAHIFEDENASLILIQEIFF